MSEKLKSNSVIPQSKRLQERAISIAVSILSPVNIHILIFASLKSLIASGTPSYSLSSIAVHPMYLSPCSILSYSLLRSSSLFLCFFILMLSYFSLNASYQSFSSFLTPNTSTQRPSQANLLRVFSVYVLSYSSLFVPKEILGSMIVSAPLQNR